MKWKTKTYNVGDIRVLKNFALFPTYLSDGHIIWLETYYIKQEFGVGDILLWHTTQTFQADDMD